LFTQTNVGLRETSSWVFRDGRRSYQAMRKAPVVLALAVIALLYLSRHFFGVNNESKLTPLDNELFRQADADSSGYVDFEEYSFWHRKHVASEPKSIETVARAFASAAAASPPTTTVANAASSQASTTPSSRHAAFDNAVIRVRGEPVAKATARFAPPPPPPPPSPVVVTSPPHAFDNSFIKTATAATPAVATTPAAAATPATATAQPQSAAAEPAALGPTYSADASCWPTLHAGYGGGAFTWGMTFKVETAAACCAACKEHARVCGGPGAEGTVFTTREFKGEQTKERCSKSMGSNEGDKATVGKCNTWVFCPTPESQGGLCWSNDVWNHTYGECWLKHQANPARPYAGAYKGYPEAYRKKHRTTPPMVQWMSGVLSEKPPVVDGPHWHW
jgi:hypothetical protein